MLKHIAVLLAFAVLAVGCAKLPFSTVDSSEPTPVTDDREVRLTSLEQTEPELHDEETLHQVSRPKTPASPLPNFLIPENNQATWNGHNWCAKPLHSGEIISCAPATLSPPQNYVCPPDSRPGFVCAPCAAAPLCAPPSIAIPGN